MATADQLIVYGGSVHHRFAVEVLRLVNIHRQTTLDFTDVDSSFFSDDEPDFAMLEYERIAGRHVIIFSCPIRPILELELRDMVMAAKHQYGAATVTVVMSFLRYRRQDRNDDAHHYQITRLRWFLKCLKDWGVDNLILCEPHSVRSTQKYADEFGLKLFVADPTPLFADALRGPIQAAGGTDNFRMYAPDFGSVGRTLRLGKALGISILASPKVRGTDGEVRAMADTTGFMQMVHEHFGVDAPIDCDLERARDKTIIMREDELDTASTATTTVASLREHGASKVWMVLTHPVCSNNWKRKLWPHNRPPVFSLLMFGNARPRGKGTQYQESTGRKVINVSLEPVVAGALLSALDTLP